MPSARTSLVASLMRIHVIVNTAARLYRTDPRQLDRIRRVSASMAEVHATANLIELGELCASLPAQGADLVILSGGDGSFMAGLTAIARAFGEDRLPRLALLPGGTVATVARNWGTSGDPAVLLARILQSRASLDVISRPTLRVKDFAPQAADASPS